MTAIRLKGNGRPEAVCECVETVDPGAPAEGEVVVDIMASAINPADVLIIEGRYPGPTEFPAFIGIEGAGRVRAVGAGVTSVGEGDHVISLGRANWAQRIKVDAAQLIRIPKDLDFRQAAMLKANPPTAHLMLRDSVDLRAGDWVIQNAANSAVGRHVIRLAGARGIRTINVVRRPGPVEELKALGGDVVLVDGPDLSERVRAAVGAEAPVRLAIDAVCGRACLRLADCLSDGGTVVNYGFLSGEPCMITPHQAIIHGIVLKGFWLVGYMRRTPRAEIEAMYAEMAQHFIDGVLDVPTEAEYALENIAEALAHAGREGRSGKILLTPNGPPA
jgi:NADPH:quinone reductase-like Zn-dependent oxidoreductase